MPANLAPITPELLKDLRDGKESALEALVRSNFDALVADAAERLEDKAAAQKVVASAFLEVWQNRADPQQPSQLADLIRQLVSSGAAHELRRRAAAHRMADTDGDRKAHAAAKHDVALMTVDEIWTRIASELHTVKKDARTRARELAEHKRHEAAAHLAQVAKPGVSKVAIIAGVVLAAVVAVPLWYANKGAEVTVAGQALAREDAKSMKSSPGQRGAVPLEDGTEVKIGSSSEVRITKAFPRDYHAMQVTGSAEVKAPTDAKNPLLIKVQNAWIYASGATVQIRDYPQDSGMVALKVTAGTVKVKGSKEEKEVGANQTLMIHKDATFAELPAEQATASFSWVGGNFAVDKMPLKQVMNELRVWYGLEIAVKDESILTRPVTMSASLESSKAAISALEEAASVKIGFEGLAMVMTDAPAGKAAPAKKK